MAEDVVIRDTRCPVSLSTYSRSLMIRVEESVARRKSTEQGSATDTDARQKRNKKVVT
jgi:hypothetical protein